MAKKRRGWGAVSVREINCERRPVWRADRKAPRGRYGSTTRMEWSCEIVASPPKGVRAKAVRVYGNGSSHAAAVKDAIKALRVGRSFRTESH